MRKRFIPRMVFYFFVFLVPCNSKGQESLFPEITGWRLVQDTSVYDANNLWDIIDGAADLYLEYAFIDLHIARYTRMDSLEVKVELYHHASTDDAFGIYSQERDPAYHFIQMGVQGYLQQGVLNFLDGKYYVKLSTYQKGTAGQEALLAVGRSLDEYMQQKKLFPTTLNFFPDEGMVPNTEQYVAKNFLGYSFMNSAFIVTYKDSVLFKMFIMKTDTPDQAETMMQEYLKITPRDSVRKLPTRSYEIKDSNDNVIVMAVQKNYFFGVIQCSSTRIRSSYFEKLRSHIMGEN